MVGSGVTAVRVDARALASFPSIPKSVRGPRESVSIQPIVVLQFGQIRDQASIFSFCFEGPLLVQLRAFGMKGLGSESCV